jgi:hypothetical protein
MVRVTGCPEVSDRHDFPRTFCLQDLDRHTLSFPGVLFEFFFTLCQMHIPVALRAMANALNRRELQMISELGALECKLAVYSTSLIPLHIAVARVRHILI